MNQFEFCQLKNFFCYQICMKSDDKWEHYRVHKSENELNRKKIVTHYVFPTSSLSHVSPTLQMWKLDKYCGRYIVDEQLTWTDRNTSHMMRITLDRQ